MKLDVSWSSPEYVIFNNGREKPGTMAAVWEAEVGKTLKPPSSELTLYLKIITVIKMGGLKVQPEKGEDIYDSHVKNTSA